MQASLQASGKLGWVFPLLETQTELYKNYVTVETCVKVLVLRFKIKNCSLNSTVFMLVNFRILVLKVKK